MHGPVPAPPPPHVPVGLSPIIGYVATREPEPLAEGASEAPEWWDEDDYAEPWGTGHPPVVKLTTAVLALCLIVAGVGTLLEIILASR
jgi:hypothetical protein